MDGARKHRAQVNHCFRTHLHGALAVKRSMRSPHVVTAVTAALPGLCRLYNLLPSGLPTAKMTPDLTVVQLSSNTDVLKVAT